MFKLNYLVYLHPRNSNGKMRQVEKEMAMENNNNHIRLSKLWMLATMTIALCFGSCSKDDDGVLPQPEQGAEFRTLLQSMDWGTDTCFVYGHKIPDVDAVCSSLAYAKLMRTLGYNCKAKVSSPINRETAYIARVFGIALPELKTSVAPQTRLILTDHTDYIQSVGGSREAVILQIIDHHTEGDIKDSTIPFVRREMVGSTNSIVYEMYNELGVDIDDETARILLAGIISDTRYLTKSATQPIDSLAILKLSSQLVISTDSIAKLNQAMAESATDYNGMTDSEIFFSDYKEYDLNGTFLGFGCLSCKQDEMEPFIDRMLAIMPDLMQLEGCQIMVAMIDNLVESTGADPTKPSYEHDGMYFLYCGEGSKDVAEALFGPSLREGVCYDAKGMSRKQIVPIIADMLK